MKCYEDMERDTLDLDSNMSNLLDTCDSVDFDNIKDFISDVKCAVLEWNNFLGKNLKEIIKKEEEDSLK